MSEWVSECLSEWESGATHSTHYLVLFRPRNYPWLSCSSLTHFHLFADPLTILCYPKLSVISSLLHSLNLFTVSLNLTFDLMWKKTKLVKPADQSCFSKTTTLPTEYLMDHSLHADGWCDIFTTSSIQLLLSIFLAKVKFYIMQNANTLPTIATFLQMRTCNAREWLEFNYELLQSGGGVSFHCFVPSFSYFSLWSLFCRLSHSWFNGESWESQS